jgi:hypothetical protein
LTPFPEELNDQNRNSRLYCLYKSAGTESISLSRGLFRPGAFNIPHINRIFILFLLPLTGGTIINTGAVISPMPIISIR